MIKLKTFVVGLLEQNTYIVSDDTREAVMIDCGMMSTRECEAVAQYVKDEQLTLKHLLLTHAHFDHACAVSFVHERYGLPVEFHSDDMWLYNTMSQQVKQFLRRDIPYAMPSQTIALHEHDVITFGSHSLECIATPGHTPGGLEFYCREEATLFSGDSLFQCSIGRTDFERSDTNALITSLRAKVMTLPAETVVYAGHGPSTTIGYEQKYNPYI